MKSKLVVLFRPTTASCVAIQITVDPPPEKKEGMREIRRVVRSSPGAKNGAVSRRQIAAAPPDGDDLARNITLD